MTSNASGSNRILGSLRSADGKGIVRMEDRFDTDIDDLWSAITEPSRLARWYAQVDGDLRPGGEVRMLVHGSGWEGTGRIEACEPPYRLLVVTKPADEPDERVGILGVGTPRERGRDELPDAVALVACQRRESCAKSNPNILSRCRPGESRGT